MRRHLLLVIWCFLGAMSVFAHPAAITIQKRKNHSIYFAWGYNKDWFSHSSIHFKSAAASDAPYDFSWEKVRAEDAPNFNHLFTCNISIPQYVYRLGYILNAEKGIGIEFAFDHAKYIVDQNQLIHIKGTINHKFYDEYTVFTKDSMHFEHTNGANFAMINAFREKSVYTNSNGKFSIAYLLKAGAGAVIPKTDVTLFGKRLDNQFHIAGYVLGAETGAIFTFWDRIFISPSFKLAFANYRNALTVDVGHAQHHFYAYELILVAGYKVNI